MQLGIREGDRLLSVTITHTVADPAAHYVNRVVVTAGGSTINDTAYTSQPTANTFTCAYPLPQGISGEVSVKAECSIAGSITRALPVPTAPTGGITVSETSLPVPVRPPVEPVASGTSQPGAATVPEAYPASPAAVPTKAGPGLFAPQRQRPWRCGVSGADSLPPFPPPLRAGPPDIPHPTGARISVRMSSGFTSRGSLW
jgi:hypothetical protein